MEYPTSSEQSFKYFLENFLQIKQLFYFQPKSNFDLRKSLDDFANYYAKKPIADNSGGAGMLPSAWIFILAKLISPSLILESGVWKGHTTWLLNKSCPDAVMHSFDINIGKLEHRVKQAHYHEHDWLSNDFAKTLPIDRNSLVYFDDHINQCKRIKQAHELGFRYAILDDNCPVINNSYNVGQPAHPTLQLLYSDLSFGSVITYEIKGETKRLEYLERDTYGVKSLIKNYFVIPNTYCHLTLVELFK